MLLVGQLIFQKINKSRRAARTVNLPARNTLSSLAVHNLLNFINKWMSSMNRIFFSRTHFSAENEIKAFATKCSWIELIWAWASNNKISLIQSCISFRHPHRYWPWLFGKFTEIFILLFRRSSCSDHFTIQRTFRFDVAESISSWLENMFHVSFWSRCETAQDKERGSHEINRL